MPTRVAWTLGQGFAAARKLNYVPSAAARALKTGTSRIILCLIQDWPATGAMGPLKTGLSDRFAEEVLPASIPTTQQGSLSPINQEEIGRMQIRYLLSKGHRRSTYVSISDPREAPFVEPRQSGAEQECRRWFLRR